MSERVRWTPVLVIGLVALVAGCGGSNSSSKSSKERTQLVSKLSAQLQQSTLHAPALTSCMLAQARNLPIAELRNLAGSGSTPNPAAKRTGAQLARTCIAQGQGAGDVRAVFIASVRSGLPASLPPAFTSCVVKRAGAIPDSQLAQLIGDAVQGTASAHSEGHAVGVALGKQCLGEPDVLKVMRAMVVAPIARGFRTSHFSVAFRSCVIGRAKAIPLAQIKQLILNPAGATAAGEAIGRRLARACIASGAKP